MEGLLMSIKVLLVHLDKAPLLAATVEQAADVAVAQGAHVIGIAAKAAEPEVPAAEAFSVFAAAMRRAGVASFEERLIEGDAAVGISAAGCYADMVILGRRERDDPGADGHAAFCEYVTMNCGCPVLMAGAGSRQPGMPRRALIAWNGSARAARALRAALPLLRHAVDVRVAMINVSQADLQQETGIQIYLARHGINAQLVTLTVDTDVGHALMALAGTLGSELLVTGFHAHPQFDDVLHRGVTRTVIQEGMVPTLLCR
jgi:nucleotide-binding universal stress UspA family protein